MNKKDKAARYEFSLCNLMLFRHKNIPDNSFFNQIFPKESIFLIKNIDNFKRYNTTAEIRALEFGNLKLSRIVQFSYLVQNPDSYDNDYKKELYVLCINANREHPFLYK